MPGVGTGNPLRTADARESKGRVALVAQNTAPTSRVTPVTLTNSAPVTAGSAVAMTLSASVSPDIPIQVGQFLLFKDSAGSYLGRVSTLFTTGTSLVLDAFEDIPANAAVEFPVNIDLLTALNDDTQTGTTSVSTFDHTGQGEVARGDTTRTAQADGLASWYSDGVKTLQYASDNERDCYFEIEDPNPDSNVFDANGPIRFFAGIVSGFTTTRTNGEKVAYSAAIGISGGITTVDPAST